MPASVPQPFDGASPTLSLASSNWPARRPLRPLYLRLHGPIVVIAHPQPPPAAQFRPTARRASLPMGRARHRPMSRQTRGVLTSRQSFRMTAGQTPSTRPLRLFMRHRVRPGALSQHPAALSGPPCLRGKPRRCRRVSFARLKQYTARGDCQRGGRREAKRKARPCSLPALGWSAARSQAVLLAPAGSPASCSPLTVILERRSLSAQAKRRRAAPDRRAASAASAAAAVLELLLVVLLGTPGAIARAVSWRELPYDMQRIRATRRR